MEEDKLEYLDAKKEARRTVDREKRKVYDRLYDELHTREGEKNVFRIAKERERNSRDVNLVKSIKDVNGIVLTKKSEIYERWKDYYI